MRPLRFLGMLSALGLVACQQRPVFELDTIDPDAVVDGTANVEGGSDASELPDGPRRDAQADTLTMRPDVVQLDQVLPDRDAQTPRDVSPDRVQNDVVVDGPPPEFETQCGDLADNDRDGRTDCADDDCFSAGFCEFGRESTCGDGHDNDGDGATDCADTDCADAASCITVCPSGFGRITVPAMGLPTDLPDRGNTTVDLPVADMGLVSQLAVQVNIAHSYSSDVELRLRNPAGATVLLVAGEGFDSDFLNTVFSDAASVSIVSGDSPFDGTFRPEQALGDLSGSQAMGTWSLLAADTSAGASGLINAVELTMCVCTSPMGCEFGRACSDGVDNDNDGQMDCADPNCAGTGTCENPEHSCSDGRDNDGDGLTDCRDPSCNGLASTGGKLLSESRETNCTDGFDNDADGQQDCADSDCAGALCTAESNCMDGIDNDSDGQTDCRDVGCSGMAGCELGTERSCGDGIDNDSDGQTDCADTDCAMLLVCVSACPPGTTTTTLSAAGGSVAIPDRGSVSKTIDVTAPGLLRKLAVRVRVPHAYSPDVDLSLTGPSGTMVDLSSDNGSTGMGYIDTVFIDAASTAITAGRDPFTGLFRPEQALSVFNNRTVAGRWTLLAADDGTSDLGTLDNFELTMCLCDGASCETAELCNDGMDNDSDGSTDCGDTSCATAPGCEPGMERTCNDGRDNDGDGTSDCRDTDCDGVLTCEVGAERSCGDHVDNDVDGITDCSDTDCAPTALCLVESDCANAMDDDGDMRADCLDPGCNGVASCEFETERSCSDGKDNDGDGQTDCADMQCRSDASCLLGCMPGDRPVSVRLDSGAMIRDNGSLTLGIPVTETGTVRSVGVLVNISHNWTGDLDLELAKGATNVILSSGNGGSGDNYLDTLFVDAATTPIASGSPPFTGSFSA